MNNNYLTQQYAAMNDFDPNSTASFKRYLNELIPYYNRELLPFIGNCKDKSILDLGCGVGTILHFLLEKGCENIVGVDNAESQLELCRKHVTTNVIEADATEFSRHTSDTFDVIIMYDLLEHIKKENIFYLIEGVYNHLNDGGILIVRTPNMAHPYGQYMRFNDFTHENGFTEQSLKQVFSQFRFKSVELHNAYIGRKRRFFIKIFNRLMCWIYNLPVSEILTTNIIVVARK